MRGRIGCARSGINSQEGRRTRYMTLARAGAYMRRLNVARFADFSDWRLPALEEALSLMEPQAYDGVHIAPVFKRLVGEQALREPVPTIRNAIAK